MERKTGIPRRSQTNLKKKASERGFDPSVDPRIVEAYVVDGARSGRPLEIKKETEDGLLANVVRDRVGREKSSEVLTYEAGISLSSALRILKKHSYKAVKPTRKPGLTRAQRSARLTWCLIYTNWTLEDFKRII